jgi:hypothetical protein
MKALKTLPSIAAFCVAAAAVAQTDGRPFDAAVVPSANLLLERNGVLLNTGFQMHLLQHGDVIYTRNRTTGPYHVLTSDGTVIGLTGGTTLAIDGRQIGFDVFRVVAGGASILGNINDGYALPREFRNPGPITVGGVIIQPNVGYFGTGTYPFGHNVTYPYPVPLVVRTTTVRL